MRVLFCSEHFPKAREYTAEVLPPGMDVVSCRQEDFREKARDADVIVPFMFRITREVMEGSRVKLINQYGAGLEGVDIEAATELKIFVANIPSHDTGNALSVAEHAIFLALSLFRKPREMERSLREMKIGFPIGETLWGKTCLIYGFGNIGKCLAERLRPFQTKILGVRRSPLTDGEKKLLDGWGTPADLKEMMKEVDLLFVCAPLTDETRDSIDEAVIGSSGKGFSLVNVSRGGVVKYSALLDGLREGKVKGAGLDVFWEEPFPPDDPLLAHPAVVATPHVGGVTEISYRTMAERLARNILRVRDGLPPENWVNPF
ncbi:MAG: hydroxyacid dehydrogenase [Deltaproteobacteria bacterium]|nr:MAG: hydroxyacid dehydrogenase [Deltaproteobacteria bacterium]